MAIYGGFVSFSHNSFLLLVLWIEIFLLPETGTQLLGLFLGGTFYSYHRYSGWTGFDIPARVKICRSVLLLLLFLIIFGVKIEFFK